MQSEHNVSLLIEGVATNTDTFMRQLISIMFALLAVMTVGCPGGRRTATNSTKPESAKVDPWAKVAASFGKLNEMQTAEIRRVLEQLNSDLANTNETSERPTPLSAEQDKKYRDLFPGFTQDDWPEITSTSFTKLDPTYLYECLFFREAVQSLEVADLPPTERARLTFAWVCRLMYLNHSTIESQRNIAVLPPVPPSYALRRGWGSGLERAFVFLAAVQQIGLDACLIGPAGSSDKAWSYHPSGSNTNSIPPGPFWAVGIRVEKEIVVFNPWTGTPAPGPNGSIATLNQLKANPDLIKAWFTGEPGALTADVVKSSEPYLALATSAMATRWAMFEAKMGTGLNLFVDPIAFRDAFGPNVKYWCPIDAFDYCRALPMFLPTDDGGRDAKPLPEQMISKYRITQFPRALLAVPPELKNPEARMFLIGQSSGTYDNAFLTGTTLRERIARGQLNEVTREIVEKEKKFSAATQRYLTQQNNIDAVKRFVIALNDAFNAKSIDGGKSPTDFQAKTVAKQNLDRLLKDSTPQFQMLLDATVGIPSMAEATYLLAQCKQEMAERLQARADRTAAAAELAAKDPNTDPKKLAAVKAGAEKIAQLAQDSWIGARSWWERYETVKATQIVAFPGREAHAKTLSQRAANPTGK